MLVLYRCTNVGKECVCGFRAVRWAGPSGTGAGLHYTVGTKDPAESPGMISGIFAGFFSPLERISILSGDIKVTKASAIIFEGRGISPSFLIVFIWKGC
jgi:hypothetical protein